MHYVFITYRNLPPDSTAHSDGRFLPETVTNVYL